MDGLGVSIPGAREVCTISAPSYRSGSLAPRVDNLSTCIGRVNEKGISFRDALFF